MSKYVSQKRIVFIVHVVVTALLFFVIIFFWINNPDFTPKILRENNVDNKFTNPILDCENIDPGNDSIISISSLENKVAAVQKKYNVTFVSLYFRDLNDGQWIGVNEKEYFSPASLLKTPLLIAFLKHAESEENLLTKKITIQNSDIGTALKQNVVSPSSLIIGNTYSLLEIAEIMIQKSNNDAANIILKYVPEKDIAAVFHYVGVPYKNERQEQNVRVKDYAGFFRILYNASYLNRDFSEQALEILSKTEYLDGLVKGVPEGVIIAHKFGERKVQTQYINGVISVDNIQLHDCGIVYYPKKPYLLCIMTRAKDITGEQKVIEELSRFIYSEVEKDK